MEQSLLFLITSVMLHPLKPVIANTAFAISISLKVLFLSHTLEVLLNIATAPLWATTVACFTKIDFKISCKKNLNLHNTF